MSKNSSPSVMLFCILSSVVVACGGSDAEKSGAKSADHLSADGTTTTSDGDAKNSDALNELPCPVTLPPNLSAMKQGEGDQTSAHAEPTAAQRLLLNIDLSKDYLNRMVEENIPTVLLDRKGINFGSGAMGDLYLSRGKTKLSLLGSAAQLEIPMQLKINACHSLFGPCRSIGSCTPTWTTNINFPLELASDYSLGKPTYSIRWGAGCKLSTMGLTIDLTNQVRAQVNAEMDKQIKQFTVPKEQVKESINTWFSAIHQNTREAGICLAPASVQVSYHIEAGQGTSLAKAQLLVEAKSQSCSQASPSTLPKIAPQHKAQPLGGSSKLNFSAAIAQTQIEAAFGEKQPIAPNSVTLVENQFYFEAESPRCGSQWYRFELPTNGSLEDLSQVKILRNADNADASAEFAFAVDSWRSSAEDEWQQRLKGYASQIESDWTLDSKISAFSAKFRTDKSSSQQPDSTSSQQAAGLRLDLSTEFSVEVHSPQR